MDNVHTADIIAPLFSHETYALTHALTPAPQLPKSWFIYNNTFNKPHKVFFCGDILNANTTRSIIGERTN